MKAARYFSTLLVLMMVLAACTTITVGTGGGQLSRAGAQDEPVTFNWSSADGGMSGTMMATLSGLTFQGRFFQITQQTRAAVLNPLWMHWHSGWNDWPYRGALMTPPNPVTQFITYYSGEVLATLESDGKLRMHCRFHLVEPAAGMSGGGEGECQLSEGRLVRAVFADK